MVKYKILYSKISQKDAQKLKESGLDKKAKQIIKILEGNPFKNPPPYEKLIGDLKGVYSRRINIKHRLIYQVDRKKKIVRILRMWTHYE